MNVTKVYLDMNVFEKIIKNGFDMGLLEKIKKNANIEYYISVGHAEEVFTAEVNDTEGKFRNENLDRRRLIESLDVKGILNPGKKGITNKAEKFEDAYKRVKDYDTHKDIENIGKNNGVIQKKKVKEYLQNNSGVKNYSRLDAKEIWEMPEVKKELENLPKRVESWENTLKYIVLPNMIYWGFGLNKAIKQISEKEIPQSFTLTYNCFSEICNDFSSLELCIEFLHEVLNKSGYNRDKGDKVISGIYDTTHSIYATYCDFLVTNDRRFQKRTNAIYYYLGVPTKVINFEDFLSWCYNEF